MSKKEGDPLKQFFRWLWYVIWEDDSILSWTINIILAFVLMKFVIYPGLAFMLSTSHPVVAVVSGSMEHEYDFDGWYESQKSFYTGYDISKDEFRDFSFSDGINTGDIIVLKGMEPEEIQIGDVIVFRQSGPEPIIHRAVRKWENGDHYYFETKGDHNRGISPVDQNIVDQRVIGKALFRIPYLGQVKIKFTKYIACPLRPQTIGCV